MSAPLFFVDGPLAEGGSVTLSPQDSHHALRALRLRAGVSVTLADGRGAVAGGLVLGERGGLAEVEVAEVRRVERPHPTVSVAVAPPKGDRLPWAIQKLVEVGVDGVTLMHTERSVRAWDPARAEKVLVRLRAVAREAAMQSRRPFVPPVDGGADLSSVLDDRTGSSVLLSEEAGVRLAGSLPDGVSEVRLLVGPEGGFTELEVRRARDSGAAVAGLGAGTLRTETAALVGATVVLARYGRLG